MRILIGESIPDGYRLNEIARELGQQPSWVSERLASLRNELLLQSGLFFPLAESEYEALRESIRRHGVQTPIVVGEQIACVDGRHRLLIAEELGLTEVPAVFLIGLSAEVERELAIGLNAARRQLSRQQKKTLVEAELMRDAARSDRLIASVCGVAHTFVADVRRELVASQGGAGEERGVPEGVVPDTTGEAEAFAEHHLAAATSPRPPVPVIDLDPPTRVDRRGGVQTTRSSTTVLERKPKRLAYLACSHGQVHSLYRDDYGEGYVLRVEVD